MIFSLFTKELLKKLLLERVQLSRGAILMKLIKLICKEIGSPLPLYVYQNN
jgi:hypothetical protein